MTKQELLSTPQYLGVEDIRKMFNCGRSKAEALIRGIKSVSDIAAMKGRVTISDYLRWYNRDKKEA